MPGYQPNSQYASYNSQFRGEDIVRIVKIQAHIRGFLAKRRLMRILQNPQQYLRADQTSMSLAVSNYNNTVVNEKLQDLIEFEWNDEFSE